MASFDPASQLSLLTLYPVDSRDETVVAGAAVDVGALEGNFLVLLDVEALTGTAPTLNMTLQHRQDATDSWAQIPAAALYDPDDGEAATFDEVTDAAADSQQLAVRGDQIKAQLRALLVIAGTTPDGICAAYVIGKKKYAGWAQQ